MKEDFEKVLQFLEKKGWKLTWMCKKYRVFTKVGDPRVIVVPVKNKKVHTIHFRRLKNFFGRRKKKQKRKRHS